MVRYRRYALGYERKQYRRAVGTLLFRGLQEWLDCYHSVNVDLWDSYNRGAIGRDYLRSERFARPLRMCGCGEEEAAAASARLDADYLDRLGRCTGLVAGADELLSALSGFGYRMGLLSNGFKEVQHRKLCSGGIASYFDTLVLSDDIGINKPDPRIFGYALERAGVSAAESVLIGDNPLTDVAGALGAGWSAVWFNPSGESASGVDFATERFLGCARTLDEVARIICKTEEIILQLIKKKVRYLHCEKMKGYRSPLFCKTGN